jgi:predicted TIM-barrel fold metal-dependent hydrolase
MPWSERVSEDEELLHIDGREYRRPLPRIATKKVAGMSMAELSSRPPGARDLKARLEDLDQEGVWAEVVYSSLGLWESMITDSDLIKAAAKAENQWKAEQAQSLAPDRLILAASLPLLNAEDAVEAAIHARGLGLHAVSLPTPGIPISKTYDHNIPTLNSDHWEPLWATLEDIGLVGAFHIGGDPGEHVMYRGPGGAVLNYTNSTYSGQRAAMLMVASGALDRHPDLKILISEGGASWVPFLGDRMEEGTASTACSCGPG